VVEVVKSSLVTCRFYECTNHLQNVLITISDRKKQVKQTSQNLVRYYKAIVVNANDYYPFGMQMPGRKFNRSTKRYRYGFNGKEKDNSIKGEGNAVDFGARIHDPRVGRWLSVDRKQDKYAFLTPYNFSANNPLMFIDVDGNDFFMPMAEAGGIEDVAAWNKFKLLIENKYNGLVTINRDQYNKKITKEQTPALNPATKYWKATMTINEEKLNQMAMEAAKKQAGENPSVDLIAQKKSEIRNQLTSSDSYKMMDNIFNNASHTGLYFVQSDGVSYGNAPRPYFGVKNININNYVVYDQVEAGFAFNLLLHEMAETYYIQSGEFANSKEFDAKDPYQYGHWTAFANEAKNLGYDVYIHNRTQHDGFTGAQNNGSIDYVGFKRLKNGKYQRVSIAVEHRDGNPLVIDGKLQYTKTVKTVTKAEMQKEVNDLKNEVKARSKKTG
jgi:RHS repeat-associated protein